MRRIILITGVSGSGKTTLQEELLNRGWKRPVNFSTRSPRSERPYEIDEDNDYCSDEMSEYVFTDKKTFMTKAGNGDFIEMTQYGGNFYGITNTFLQEESKLYNENICIIVDPVGRAQIMENLNRNGIEFECYYISISKEEQERRLLSRGDKQEEITKRKRDFGWFHKTNKCITISGELSTEEMANFIEGDN